ncbi:MarR family transcriptional regulator [Ideonella sp. DXS22W]|uniref:MarR family transcriptional regulator n=1 Tax=Pseudaquabacterium inlustre TaxID=2984192 RepID=A0ABU9CK24_9BURK
MPPDETLAAPSPAECADAVLDVVPAVMDAVRDAMRRHADAHFSVPQFRCLNFIHRQPGCAVGAVAAFLGVTMPTASAMVDRLVRAGAVRTETAPDDRRRTQLHITPEGRAQLRQIRRAAHADLSRALARHCAADLQALQQGLAVLQRSFSAA